MSNKLKAVGVLGVGAIIAFSVLSSEPTPAPSKTSNTANTFASSEKPKPAAKPTLVPTEEKAAPTPTVKPAATTNCHPSYSGCLKMNARDYDCRGGSGNGPNYTGAVKVYGSDPFGLDRDNDGWGCE